MEKVQLEALNFEVKAIETYLDHKFEGSTVEQKQEFVKNHWEEWVAVTTELMRTAFEEYEG